MARRKAKDLNTSVTVNAPAQAVATAIAIMYELYGEERKQAIRAIAAFYGMKAE